MASEPQTAGNNSEKVMPSYPVGGVNVFCFISGLWIIVICRELVISCYTVGGKTIEIRFRDLIGNRKKRNRNDNKVDY